MFRPRFIALLAVALIWGAISAGAQSVYNFVVDPNQSNLTLDFSVSYDGDPWIESHDSASVQGAWQAEYTPGTGNLDSVSLRNGAIVLNDDLTIRGSEKIAVIEISIEGNLRNARLEFVQPSDEAALDSNGEAFLTGHKLRLTGTFDYEWRIECDFGTTEDGDGAQQIDVEIPAPTDYRTSPHQGVAPGQQVTGSFDCSISETFTCNLLWLLDIQYDIVAHAIAPDAGASAGEVPPSAFAPAQAAPVQSDGHFTASAFNYSVGQNVNWVDTYRDKDLLYNLLPGTWTALLVYDHALGKWTNAHYIWR